MRTWLSDNLINIVLIAVIALIVALLIRSMIRDKKAGKSACGGNCAGCGACGECRKGDCMLPEKTNKTAKRNPSRLFVLLLCMAAALSMLNPLRAQADAYTQLTRMTFSEVAALIDGGENAVFYHDCERYTEVGYVTEPNNPNWYYLGPKDSVSPSDHYYSGRGNNYYYSNSGPAAGTQALYAAPIAPEAAAQTLFVRLVGSFDNMITGQQSGADAVSSATTGGSAYYSGSAATAHVEYALAAPGTDRADIPEEDWHKPDYFVNGGDMTIDGTRSRVVISPEGSGMESSFNWFSGELALTGVAGTPGHYEVRVELTGTEGRSDTSNALPFTVWSGSETLAERLRLENCTQTADGRYMFDQEPWYITDFGSDTVAVPVGVKAWYGSHGALPTPNYGELGATISLSGGQQPFQTLVIPGGCDLTMVNMRVHSGVKLVVETGARLVLRQSIIEGIVEVRDGGRFTMDYNDYGEDAGWLYGSSLNGQLRLLDGAVLDHARIVSHANYSAHDDEARENYEPIVTVDGTVTLVGDVYILGDEAPAGEAGQPGLLVRGTLEVPAGSTLAVYGGGSSFLTADGGDAILLDGGEIVGDGSVIAVGGYGMNLTEDESKGSGGAAVSGSGRIAVTKAYLEGGSSFQTPGEATSGEVDVTETPNLALVKGAQGNETSDQYWHGTGDTNGTVPDVEKTLALVPDGGAVGVKTKKVAISVRVEWTDGAEAHEAESVGVCVKDENGDAVAEATITAADGWKKTVAESLIPEAAYSVEAAVDGAYEIEIVEGRARDAWDREGQLGNVAENATYLISYTDESGATCLLGAANGALGSGKWNGEGPEDIPAAFRWRPVFASSSYGWYLMNEGTENSYLSMTQSGLDVLPALRERGDYDYYYALVIDDDGSIWSNNFGQNLLMANGRLTASANEWTEFRFHALLEKAEKPFTVILTPSAPAVPVPDFELPALLTEIGEEAFAGVTASCIEIPKNVTTIGPRAFAHCPKLSALFIPVDVETIEDDALSGCGAVTIYGSAAQADGTESEAHRFARENGFAFVDLSAES